jgi:hypothetical protein
MQYHIRAASERCFPSVRTVALLLHIIFIIRTGVQTVLPWRPDGCNSFPHLALSMITSGRCCPVVQTDAAVFPYLCLRRKSDFLSNIDEHPDELLRHPDGCNLELFETSGHWWASGRMLLTDERPDAVLGHPDGNKGSDFSELEFTQNLPWTLKKPYCNLWHWNLS